MHSPPRQAQWRQPPTGPATAEPVTQQSQGSGSLPFTGSNPLTAMVVGTAIAALGAGLLLTNNLLARWKGTRRRRS